MFMQRLLMGLVVIAFTFGTVALTDQDATVGAQDKKKEKSPFEGKKGTVIGTLTDKGTAFIEVKAFGEEKGRRYIPHWVGGAPSAGGGPDKKMVKIISELKVGSRVEVEWLFEEHWRVISVKTLKGAEKDKK